MLMGYSQLCTLKSLLVVLKGSYGIPRIQKPNRTIWGGMCLLCPKGKNKTYVQ